jgi:hypothetical protein
MLLAHSRISAACRGFSYVEVLLSVALMVTLLVPAMRALEAGIMGTPARAFTTARAGLQTKMEEVLAAPFSRVYAETYLPGGNTTSSVSAAFSDAPGTPDRRVVVLYRYDALTKAVATADTGLVFVSVYYTSQGSSGALNTLAGVWW